MKAAEAKARVNAIKKKYKEEDRKMAEAEKRIRAWNIKQTLKDAHAQIAECSGKGYSWADIDVNVVAAYHEDLAEVMASLLEDGYTVHTYEVEVRDYDEPLRAPDKVMKLRMEW